MQTNSNSFVGLPSVYRKSRRMKVTPPSSVPRENEQARGLKEDHEDGGIKGTGGKFQKGSEGETRWGVFPTAQE